MSFPGSKIRSARSPLKTKKVLKMKSTLKKWFAVYLACFAVMLSAARSYGLELESCPPPVIKTVNDNLDTGEKVLSIKLITEGDWSYYEITTNQEGYMTVDPDGTLESIDLGTDIDDLPVAAKRAIKKLPGKLYDVYMELNDNGVAEYTVETRVKGVPSITKISATGAVLK